MVGSFNLCISNEWDTIKVRNCNELRKNRSRESIIFRLSFIKVRDFSLNSKRFLSISKLNYYFLSITIDPKLTPIHEFSLFQTSRLNDNQTPPSNNPPLRKNSYLLRVNTHKNHSHPRDSSSSTPLSPFLIIQKFIQKSHRSPPPFSETNGNETKRTEKWRPRRGAEIRGKMKKRRSLSQGEGWRRR